MESFLNNVDGCTLTIKDFHSAISFPTPSDAIFASVILKYANLTMELFDDLFTIFHLTEFHSDSLKMTRTQDILGHIADQRRSLATTRARGAERDQSVLHSRGRVPLLVVDLVAEHLDTERLPFHRTILSRDPASEADDLLREMSLVHRSWTEAAQRSLRRRICFRGQLDLGLLLQSPQLGPWVRDLSIISYLFPLAIAEGHPGSNYGDTPKLIKTILKICPNVVNLHLQDFQPRMVSVASPSRSPVNGTSHDIVPALGDLNFLENIWLHQVYDPPATSLPELCALIPRLQCLKSLSLQNWTERNTVELETDKQSSTLTSVDVSGSNGQLEALSLIGINDTSPLSRLTNALQEHTPTVLELSLYDMRFPPGIGPGTGLRTKGHQPFVEPVKPYITKLMLSEYLPEDDVTSVVKQFPSLKVLVLCIAYFSSLPHPPFVLPSSTRFLHVHFCMVPTEAQDPFAIAMLEASPLVQNLSVSYNNVGPEHGFEMTFTDTIRYCKDNNVQFELNEVEGQPSFLDLRLDKYL